MTTPPLPGTSASPLSKAADTDALINIDARTVESFGREWSDYDQTALDQSERNRIFDSYFAVFPWDRLPPDAEGFDMGCGSGRWALNVAPRVGTLHCVDASDEALGVARTKLKGFENVDFHHASVDAWDAPDGTQDFGYSLGVLHHVPDTLAAIKSCVRKLKPGAPFLIYLYYRFDNGRPALFVAAWRASDLLRRAVIRLDHRWKRIITESIAATVYWPVARLAKLVGKVGGDTRNWPLSAYADKSFYTMRTDAFDRFATPLEQRFSRREIEAMMTEAGLTDIRFHDGVPYWTAVGFKTAG